MGQPGPGRIHVERVPADLSYELRHRVLRPHQRVQDMRFPGDDETRAGTYAAFGPADEVIGVATVRPEACPWLPDETEAWRLRGMATAEGRRGGGVGGAVLRAAIDHAVREGGTLLWCNARVPAQRFYERAGFTVHGDPWEDPKIGPHVAMWRRIGRHRRHAAPAPLS